MTTWLALLAQEPQNAGDLAWPAAAGGVAAVVTTLAVLAGLARWLWVRVGKPVGEFLDDWRGQPPRPGFSGRPGVPERLTTIEGRLSRVETELSPNGGHSMKDHVSALARRAGVDGEE